MYESHRPTKEAGEPPTGLSRVLLFTIARVQGMPIAVGVRLCPLQHHGYPSAEVPVRIRRQERVVKLLTLLGRQVRPDWWRVHSTSV